MPMAEARIEVQAPAAAAYDAFAGFERVPDFMRDVIEVRRLDDEHLLWVEQVDGRRQEWHAQVTDARPGERLAWESTGPFPRSAGTVTFEALGAGRTAVQLQLDVDAQGGPDDRGSADRAAVEARVNDALQRFKRLVEGHAHSRLEVAETIEPRDSLQGEGLPGPGGGA